MSVLRASAPSSLARPAASQVLCCPPPAPPPRFRRAGALGHGLQRNRQEKINLRCASQRRNNQEDFADKIGRQVEEEVRRAIEKSAIGSKWDKERGSADFAADVADKAERGVRKVMDQPGQALLVGGALLLGAGMLIGPAIAAVSLAIAGLSIGFVSSMAFGAMMVAFSVAFGAMALGVFGGLAIPLVAPFIVLAMGFLGVRYFTKPATEPIASAGQPAVDTKAEEEEREYRERERAEEERKREIEQELKAFDDLMSKRSQRKDGR
mmetsp:Transcript_4839/g.13466  ORF Transcript_4839/g.13466 Transcript_4839/m.13466 type:complete len:266 (+) Transcript_4839:177-974(+)